MTIRAIFERGVFRPIETVEFPEACEVEIEVRQINGHANEPTHAPMNAGLAKVYEVLGRRHSSGHTDTAERHNEHQP